MEGRIIRGVGGFYTVRDAEGNEYTLRARGRFRREGLTPLVGDLTQFTPGQGDEHGWLDAIMPRSSVCLRPPVANISLLVVVVAPEPQPDLLLVDRLLVYVAQFGFSAVLCANKIDLNPDFPQELSHQYAASATQMIAVSVKTGEGVQALRARMAGEICCMAGQSAVGKSTLLNALCGLRLKTGDLSERTRRGKHTTRHAELLEAEGLVALDTPGFSLLSLDASLAPEDLGDFYPEYAQRAEECRFSPCLHDREPDCAVREAVQSGKLSRARYDRYLVLLSEARETWKGRYG